MSKYLFVYGTLLPDTASESMTALLRRVRRAGLASVRGTLHDLGSFPALSLDAPDDESIVRGELLVVPSAAAWMRLDMYEGCDRARPEQSLYRRKLVEASHESGERTLAWTYVYNKDLSTTPRIPGGCWKAHLSQLDEIVVP